MHRDHWAFICRSLIVRQPVCVICGGIGPRSNLDVHERWSFHDNDDIAIQVLEGLDVLCPACHEVKHLALAAYRDRLRPALQHFERVTKMKPKEIGDHIERALGWWKAHETTEWQLDIAWFREKWPAVKVREAGQPADMEDLMEMQANDIMYKQVVELRKYSTLRAQAEFFFRENVLVDHR